LAQCVRSGNIGEKLKEAWYTKIKLNLHGVLNGKNKEAKYLNDKEKATI